MALFLVIAMETWGQEFGVGQAQERALRTAKTVRELVVSAPSVQSGSGRCGLESVGYAGTAWSDLEVTVLMGKEGAFAALKFVSTR